MIVFKSTKQKYLAEYDGMTLADEISKNLQRAPNPGNSEYQSWEASFEPIARLLKTEKIPDDVGVTIEYGLKIGNFRIDYFLTGKDAQGNAAGVIVELKQWSLPHFHPKPGDPTLFLVGGEGCMPKVHPSYQAWSYKVMLDNYNRQVQETPVLLHPCSYLFNYLPGPAPEPDILRSPENAEVLSQSPLYDRKNWGALKSFLEKTFHQGDPSFQIIDSIDASEIRPSKALQDAVKDMLEGNAAFTLVDSQQVVFRHAYTLVLKGMEDGKKRAYIVHGGPGTGKSVIAINLMSRLLIDGIPQKLFRKEVEKVPESLQRKIPGTRENRIALYCPYVTKADNPRKVYKTLLLDHSAQGKKWGSHMLEGLFIGAKKACFRHAAEKPIYAGLIVDESHRLNGVDRFNQKEHGNYLEGILTSAYTTIFFIDDRQQISTEDYGSTDTIKRLAAKHGIEVQEDVLETEFRCVAGNAFISWIDRLLYGPADQVGKLPATNGFEVKVFDDVSEMHDAIIARDKESSKQESVTSRVVAGYCWNWVSDEQDEIPDIRITENGKTYERYWNMKADRPFAIGESRDQVGCIHTCQGLEFAYVGVIIGDDLRYEDGKIITDKTKRAKRDNTLNNRKGSESASPDQLIRNTYRVLLTRGQKGCYIYCTNKPLAKFLKAHL